MTEVMPFIRRTSRKIDGAGTVIEDEDLTVQGPDFEKVIEEFDKRWKK